MEPDQNNLASLFPNIAAHLRGALSNLHLASAQLAPPSAREQDPALDARAALLDQSYYQMLRLVSSLSAAAYLASEEPLPLQDRDIVGMVSKTCEEAGSLAPLLAEGYGQARTPEELSWFGKEAAGLLQGQKLYFCPERELLEGAPIRYYIDDSIAVVTWKEVWDLSVLTFAEVTIADGSQFRRFLADGRYGAQTQYKTTEMAQTVNAVLASSGDFYKFHYNGVVVYENQLRNIYTNRADTCYINDQGDLLFTYQNERMTEEEARKFIQENNVRFSLAFGPVLVDDSQRCEPETYDLGEVNSHSSRAALCQLGKLHYLVVTANPEDGHPGTLTIHQFAERIAQTGCRKAYTLDGGQTAAIALDGELVNHVLYGQQRPISDIIYFATAVGG